MERDLLCDEGRGAEHQRGALDGAQAAWHCRRARRTCRDHVEHRGERAHALRARAEHALRRVPPGYYQTHQFEPGPSEHAWGSVRQTRRRRGAKHAAAAVHVAGWGSMDVRAVQVAPARARADADLAAVLEEAIGLCYVYST